MLHYSSYIPYNSYHPHVICPHVHPFGTVSRCCCHQQHQPICIDRPITQPQSTPSQRPVEHSTDFKIVIVLDESGSMEPIRHEMIKALNDLINEQKQLDRPCRLTLVKFNDKTKRVIENTDLKKIRNLTLEDYNPDKTTALYDAIGSTIEWFRYESDVLLVIVTDGQENASTKYNKDQIISMLDEKKKFRKWTYVYLSNDLSNSIQGMNLGFDNSVTSTNRVIDQHHFGAYLSQNVNQAIYNYRANGQSVQSQL
jgi:hypothetical protein